MAHPTLPQTHLQNDDIIVTERAELVAPGGIMADDLIDDILEVQCELLYRQVLALGMEGGRKGRGNGTNCPYPSTTSRDLPYTHLDRCPLAHGPQVAPSEIGDHERQGDLVILELWEAGWGGRGDKGQRTLSAPAPAFQGPTHHPRAPSLRRTPAHSTAWCS